MIKSHLLYQLSYAAMRGGEDGVDLRTCQGPGRDGERGRDRTFDLLVKSQLLYRLSYAPDRGVRAAGPKDIA